MPQRKKFYRSIADSEKLLQEFYENLGGDTFFGHSFIGKDDAEEHDTLSSDSNIEEAADVEPTDEVEYVDVVGAVPRKQKFLNLDDV